MEALTRITSRAAILPDADIDTDIIFPARFLLITTKVGLGHYAFYEKRYEKGVEKPDFPLSQVSARSVQILITGANFGCGSSREQAVWALRDLGVRVILAPSFGEIFYSNCFKSAVLPIALTPDELAPLSAAAAANRLIKVNLVRCEISAPNTPTVKFHLEDWRRYALLKGWDEVLTLLNTQAEALTAFERRHRADAPWLFAAD
jgi:3-isopropylmalate/(R)-2-methylmalate dehydratase small subunit